MIKIDRIQLNNFRFFTDEEENNTFKPNAKGMLVYGENGSGKSSLYKAFEFLATPTISEEEFAKNVNIFQQDDTYLQFEFNNEETLKIDSDHLSLENDFDFISKLSIPRPIMDYKSLLKVSYSTQQEEKKNLYIFFEKILSEYPIGQNKILKNLKEEEDESYFSIFEKILKEELFDEINSFLELFEQNFKLTEISFNFGFHKVNLEIEYFDKTREDYHSFLNEARLSALAMSIYFSIIKNQFDNLEDNSLKILILDDLLISLDMNNRLSLINILENKFRDFQIFFFTHEKALYDLINEKMNLKAYEIYVNKKDGYEVPFIKQSNPLMTQAIYQKERQNYGCSANILRQYTEKLLCDFLPKELILDRRCKVLNLDTLLRKAKTYEETKSIDKNQDIIDSFVKLRAFKRILLNDASHYNSTEIYKSEVENTIEVLATLGSIIYSEDDL